jgi:hypothetical protein
MDDQVGEYCFHLLYFVWQRWRSCIPGAGRRQLLEEKLPGELLLAQDKPESVVPFVAKLLEEAAIRVLIYNGDRDLSTCVQGSETLLDEMEWSGSDGWKTVKHCLWMVNDNKAGYAKLHQGLDFVVVSNLGHLVPNNVPIPALDQEEDDLCNLVGEQPKSITRARPLQE